jgi:hypothetical protein
MEAHVSAIAGDALVDEGVMTLVDRFLRQRSYDRTFALELFDIARARRSTSWETRRLAVLMLEHQLLKIPDTDEIEFGFWLTRLGIAPASGANGSVRAAMRKEGYSTIATADFVAEFKRRLARLNRVHLAVDAPDRSGEALDDFVHAARSDCKLTLMRYVLTPEEVAGRICGDLRMSTGVSDLRAYNQPDVCSEIDRALDELPAFEADLLRSLCGRSTIYWISPAVSSEINALVASPINTVVAVVRPPGSDVEFELKRTGVKGGLPMTAVFARDGVEVPPTHRLNGGSMAYYLRWEAMTAAGLAKIYRLIHQEEAPISRTIAVSTVYGVPVDTRAAVGPGNNEAHVLDYFRTLQDLPEFDATRDAMRASIAAFRQESGTVTPAVGGDLGLVTQFLGQVVPAQSILSGTTAFRLDRLDAYLSADGAAIYFEQGLNRSFDRADARRFADELLEEVLGEVTVSGVAYENHAQYVDATLALPANRARADRHYLSIMRDLGMFRGTLLGLRSYSYGESFVARNVGLKSVWEQGDWRVRIIFMDHDVMYLTGRMSRDFHPLSAIPGMAGDDRHIWGHHRTRGALELLRSIYRIDPAIECDGRAAMRDAVRASYRRTHDAIRRDRRVKGCFFPEFVERLHDWDEIAANYLRIKNDPSARESWRDETERFLQSKGYAEDLRTEWLTAIERHASFLDKYAFVY